MFKGITYGKKLEARSQKLEARREKSLNGLCWPFSFDFFPLKINSKNKKKQPKTENNF